jgi:acetolactate synthase I/II/III large subunit
MKIAELIVKCLEAEGVEYIFGLPGEENLELLEALTFSKMRFVLTRDERGAAFMANTWGRLSRKPGVCLSTLGPGALNMATGIADAYLDFAPLVAITAQAKTTRLHRESHQYVDILSTFKSLTKWNTRLGYGTKASEVLRKAFRVSLGEKQGPVHLEIPEDIMSLPTDEEPVRPSDPAFHGPSEEALSMAIEVIRESREPIILAGNGVIRGDASGKLRDFSRKAEIPVTTTFMGMGSVPADDRLFISTIGLQSRDWISCGFDRTDLIIAIGYDPVEFSTEYWGKDKKILHINATSAEVDLHYHDGTEVIGDIKKTLSLLTERISEKKDPSYFMKLKGLAVRSMGGELRGFPLKPLRVVKEIRDALGRKDILISDVGAHKIWIGRFYPALEENTLLISNGLSSMGFALPSAISAKLLFPGRKVVAAVGDGGFLMSVAELETAVRFRLPFVILIFNDGGFGLIAWKERLKYKKDFFVRFGNPDFVKLAESFGAKGYRVSSDDGLAPVLRNALTQDGPVVIDCPVDYSENFVLSEKLGGVICPM